MTNQKTSVSNQPNILDLLDFCKGFLILLIVYFHFHKGDGFGWQGVHPFIVFSGFGLTYSCLRARERRVDIIWKSWLLRRAERLLPTYWLVCFIAVLLLIRSNFLVAQKHCDLSACLLELAKGLFLEVSFLKILSYQTMWSFGFLDHLWFIPFIVSFYLIFPLLFKFLVSKGNVTKICMRLFVISLLVEFLYRFFAIYFLDGFPIGYENSIFGMTLPSALDSLAPDFPFQLQMPFGLFPSRIAEFVLGMAGAVALIYHPRRLSIIFSSWMTGLGFLIWGLGSALLYARLGWVVSDFFIALGLVLIVVNLAWICQKHSSFLFSQFSMLGLWSYCIYLIHNLFKYFQDALNIKVMAFWSFLFRSESKTLFLYFMVDVMTMVILGAAILLASWMLLKFDRSKFPKFLIQRTLGKVM